LMEDALSRAVMDIDNLGAEFKALLLSYVPSVLKGIGADREFGRIFGHDDDLVGLGKLLVCRERTGCQVESWVDQEVSVITTIEEKRFDFEELGRGGN